jgi:hypothetical protein
MTLHAHMDTIYKMVGSGVVGYFANAIIGFFKHCFWQGFKDSFVATVNKGSALTPEELAAVKTKTLARLNSEWQGKMKKFANVLDDGPAPIVPPTVPPIVQVSEPPPSV